METDLTFHSLISSHFKQFTRTKSSSSCWS